MSILHVHVQRLSMPLLKVYTTRGSTVHVRILTYTTRALSPLHTHVRIITHVLSSRNPVYSILQCFPVYFSIVDLHIQYIPVYSGILQYICETAVDALTLRGSC